MAHPVPTMAFLQPSPEAAMLFVPFGCTHSPALSAGTKLKSQGHWWTSWAQNLL